MRFDLSLGRRHASSEQCRVLLDHVAPRTIILVLIFITVVLPLLIAAAAKMLAR